MNLLWRKGKKKKSEGYEQNSNYGNQPGPSEKVIITGVWENPIVFSTLL